MSKKQKHNIKRNKKRNHRKRLSLAKSRKTTAIAQSVASDVRMASASGEGKALASSKGEPVHFGNPRSPLATPEVLAMGKPTLIQRIKARIKRLFS